MKMEPIVSSERSAIRTHAGELPKKEQITFRTRRKLKNKNIFYITSYSHDFRENVIEYKMFVLIFLFNVFLKEFSFYEELSEI